jgi:hypothetical protein
MIKNLEQLADKANTVKTAKSRAKIAALILVKYDTVNCRAFDNCFENGEAEKVASIIRSMARKDIRLYTYMKKHIPSLVDDSTGSQLCLFN